jgi:uncharacterized glyoxalase superfamily protein PhnB
MGFDIYPTLRYRDAHAAIDFLERAFGFERTAVHEDGGIVHHAELQLGNGGVMLGSAERATDDSDQLQWEPGGASVYVIVDDPDARFARAEEAGAEIVRGLRDEDYGSRGFTARDPEGNLWSLGTYRPESQAA